MEAVYKFAEYMNVIFDVLFHPIQTLRGISYPVCLVMSGVMIIFGIIGFKNCYRWSALFVIVYVLINMM